MSADTSDSTSNNAPTSQPLAKLTPQQFKTYNHMAEHMDMFHNHFRQTWNLIYNAATSHSQPRGMTIKQFLNVIQQFISQLTTHHAIEERYVFPVLAEKMPRFREHAGGKGGRGELLVQHEGIHRGLEELGKWVEEVKGGERGVVWEDLEGVMDGFGKGLWEHLDEEVRELGAENMRLYWTEGEMRGMSM